VSCAARRSSALSTPSGPSIIANDSAAGNSGDRPGRRVSAPSAGGARELAAAIARLDELSIAVDEIGVRRPTLDEVFLTLTGGKPDGQPAAGQMLEGSSR
jgi:hypothetical protein